MVTMAIHMTGTYRTPVLGYWNELVRIIQKTVLLSVGSEEIFEDVELTWVAGVGYG